MSSLEGEAGIKRENTTVYVPERIPLLNERDPHGSETYGFRGGNFGGKPRSHINTGGI